VIEDVPRGPGRVPWQTAGCLSFPGIVPAGQEISIVQTKGYSSAALAIFNPNGNTIPAGTYQMNLYACGQNFEALIASLILATGAPQVLRGKAPCAAWLVKIQFLLANATSWGARPPTVSLVGHGRE